MERKIYDAPEAEVFVMELSHMVAATGPVEDVASNMTGANAIKFGGSSDKDTSGRGAMSKDRGSDDFDWDLGF